MTTLVQPSMSAAGVRATHVKSEDGQTIATAYAHLDLVRRQWLPSVRLHHAEGLAGMTPEEAEMAIEVLRLAIPEARRLATQATD